MSDQIEIEWGDLPTDMTRGFWEFHNTNPHVMDRLEEMTRDLVSRGRKRIGMKMLFEVLRWEYFMATETNEPFKLNNNYTAYYARLIEKRNPQFEGVFAKRQSKGDEVAA